MADQKLRFWRQVTPTPGEVSLVFGDWPGVQLRFVTPVSPTPGPVALVFGAQPRLLEDIEGTLAAALPAPSAALALAAQGDSYPAADYVDGTLAAALPAPVAPALELAAAGNAFTPAQLAATLPAAALPALTFAATETLPRMPGALAAALPAAPVPALALAAIADLLTPAQAAAILQAVVLPPLALASIAIDYDIALPDAIGPGIAARHLAPRDAPAVLAAPQQQMIAARTPAAARTLQAAPLPAGAGIVQQQMIAASRASLQRAQHGAALGNGRRLGHADTLRQQRVLTAAAQHGIALAARTRSDHQERIRTRHRLRTDQQQGTRAAAHAPAGHRQGLPLARGAALHQQQMIPLPLGWWQIAYPWPAPPIDPNAPSSPVALRFCRLADGTTALVFGCPPPPQPGTGTIVVPVRRTYLVLNTVTLVRASDSAPLTALSLALQIDTDSWTWGWDASIPGAELALVEPIAAGEPVELIATVNGEAFRLLAERIARDRRFAQSRLRISGRGRAAMLADPHSPIVTRSNGSDRSAQQLLADALTDNGVALGWTLDWQAADWLVPAGLYNHTGPYIAHAQRLAEAAGAYVQADPLTDTLRILPRYPLLPWEWDTATPDVDLPSAPVVREAIEWLQRPDYNRVFVSGTEAGGILGQVTRAGTAGDVVAPMVTDPLVTHADAARARGRAILADTGRQARITLDLPILPETGILTPGQLIRYTDAGTPRTGLVRSTAVRAQLPAARQTIELETHLQA